MKPSPVRELLALRPDYMQLYLHIVQPYATLLAYGTGAVA